MDLYFARVEFSLKTQTANQQIFGVQSLVISLNYVFILELDSIPVVAGIWLDSRELKKLLDFQKNLK